MNLTLFDLDHTLLPLDSDHAFGEFLVQQGWADPVVFREGNDRFYADYVAGRLDMHAYVAFATAAWRGRGTDELDALTERFMAQVIRPVIGPKTREVIARHRDAGDRLALVTATNEFVTAPIARELGFETLIATALARDAQGRVTGDIDGIPNLREGKVVKVGAWLAAQGLDWHDFERSTCYSDSTNDLPLLEKVTHPVATHPAPALERIALERGWPILRWFDNP